MGIFVSHSRFLMRKSCLLFLLAFSFVATAQQKEYVPPTKAQLEAKRKEIQDAINDTEHQLEEIKKNKNATMSQLRALQYKLAQRQTLIGNINEEIGSIDNTIVSSSKEIMTLKQKLELLKVRYAQSLRYAYQTRSSYDMLAFLFSSQDFNDAVRRMKYLKKFREFRKQQVDQIRQTQNQIEHKIGDLNKEKQEKDQLLLNQKQQTVALQGDVQQTNTVIQGLKGKEAELAKEIEKNRIVANRINKAIGVIIEREMAAALKKAEDEEKRRLAAAGKPVTPASNPKDTRPAGNGKPDPSLPYIAPKPKPAKADAPPLMMTPTEVALAANFEGNHGKLYWPVAQGSISDHFGTHPHPLAKSVMVDQAGIDIRTSPSAAVRAVFEGTVSSVFSTGGSDLIVIIQHGNYFTVYNGLASVSVKNGQHVDTRQPIGIVANNDEGEPTVNFQIWKSAGKGAKVKLNPETWIGKAH
ncbi:hypothetical protein CJD36_008055 [Flavipsychrobacter stenotrophus]|uniref:M23ase beta-sheet core domain-containing protein n=2 Tax=Flavipsychrobacter stenotrophus TaxID=2077091 RepID=A0A2S7SXS9_9BACT|nr:hypothetical protein CJD36_008055 [Flavipsychrobacter stenotrophus]